jgi:tRNA dimethylallyltransferase
MLAPSHEPTLLMLAGPTGIGKTGLAVEMAQRFGLEIISADSMQVYRGMAVGTAQPTAAERSRARFHVCGMLDPREPFSVQRFVELCDAAHRRIVAAGRLPIYVGGTGLYLRALRWGLFEQEASDPAVRRALEDELRTAGAPAMHRRLAGLDPEAAAHIAPADAVRIVRALEVQAVTGRRMSELQRQWARPRPRFRHELVVLVAPRELVRRRIAERARIMLTGGWIEETRALLAAGVDESQHCFKALGYREVIDHIRGKMTFDELVARITTLTQQFARRQMVWLRRERPALWLEAGEGEKASKVQASIQKLLEKFHTPYV